MNTLSISIPAHEQDLPLAAFPPVPHVERAATCACLFEAPCRQDIESFFESRGLG